MIYTCYEMVRDCRADMAEGWRYFAANYVPLIRKLLAHYATDDPASLERVLRAIRDPRSSMFQPLEPAPERWFVAELRQAVLGQFAPPPPAIAIDLETVAAALEPLTVVEKQAAWTETMRYTPAGAGAMMRVSEETVEKIRGRAAEMIRQKSDAWSRDLLAANGRQLGVAAAADAGTDCLPAKTFLDIIDGRMTWRSREEMERHVNGCWHCIDHFCRMLEVVELMRGLEPLSEDAAAPFRKMLGVPDRKKKRWWHP